ncbi:uncharacterized protein F5147DRAFT_719873 [Suillus discolor]|uniref:Secreted protein n=1 Tax=Suillus discolor TaxID=1912936 RepID=A0A9P7EVX2_9AGAM|nr:uncharacterized protein F5147DRAFT_719873 [Suillus discolor]KAG2094224.1 hypothetical protein F5147DRAFT_719873 [Suillus discolor]
MLILFLVCLHPAIVGDRHRDSSRVYGCCNVRSATICIKDQPFPIIGPPAVGFANRRQISTGLTLCCTCIKDTLPVSKFPSDPITLDDAAI